MRNNLLKSLCVIATFGVAGAPADSAPVSGFFGRGGGAFPFFANRSPAQMGRFGFRGPRRFSPPQSHSPIYGNGSEGYRRPPPNPYPETAVPGPIYGRGYPVRVASRPVPDDPPPRERIWHPVVQHHVHRDTPPPLLARPVTSRPRSIVHMRTAGPVPPLHIAPVPPPPHKEPVRATVVAERFVPKELLIKFRGETPSEMIEAFAREQKLERISIEHFEMIDSTYYRYRLMRPDAVGAVAKTLESHALVAAIQPNYKYDLEDAPGAPGYSAAQYAVSKMSLNEAHRRAVGSGELVAVIDSGVDARHPELEGSVKEQFDEVGEDNRPDPHGTSVAGVIGAHAQLVGVAPRAQILAIRAFSRTLSDPGAQGTTLHIARAIELAHARGVRLVNMSFAGPKDPMIEEEVRNGHRQKMIFVAAAGNDGPKSAPLYPAAYSEVIAATATDARDRLYSAANVGAYISVAAPGVDLLVAEPGDAYQFRSGTSFAAAEVTGVIALLLQLNPSLDEGSVRTLLAAAVQPPAKGPGNAQNAAGRINALAALTAADALMNDNGAAAKSAGMRGAPSETPGVDGAAAQ